MYDNGSKQTVMQQKSGGRNAQRKLYSSRLRSGHIVTQFGEVKTYSSGGGSNSGDTAVVNRETGNRI